MASNEKIKAILYQYNHSLQLFFDKESTVQDYSELAEFIESNAFSMISGSKDKMEKLFYEMNGSQYKKAVDIL